MTGAAGAVERLPGQKGRAVTLAIAATSYVKDKVAFVKYYEANRSAIDPYLAYVDLPSVASDLENPESGHGVSAVIMAVAAGAAAGLLGGYLLFRS